MRIEHVALWVADIDRVCAFHERFFGARNSRQSRRAFGLGKVQQASALSIARMLRRGNADIRAR